VIVSTPTIRHIAATGRKRILLNRHRTSARRGLVVSGPSDTEKGTSITRLRMNVEQFALRRHPHLAGSLPVVYVTVPPAATPKMLAVELTRFIGLPLPFRFSQVCDLLCTLGTRLVLLDEINDMAIAARIGAEAADQIKYLSDRAQIVVARLDG
jgi:Bacterial TniB protein